MKVFKQNYLLFLLSFTCLIIGCAKKVKPTTASKIDSVNRAAVNPYSNEDQSQMDMSYFPVDYPIEKMNNKDTAPPVARIIYSRPHKKGRSIFGTGAASLCVYGKPWRLGANEATEITFFKNVVINGKNFTKGSYIIYCLPYPDKWTIIFNNNLYTWGLHINEEKDIFRTDIPVMTQTPVVEDFTIVFTPATYGADLIMAWDTVKATLPIEFSL